MSWFTDYRSHYFVGYLKGLALRSNGPEVQRSAILRTDEWAWGREWAQNRKSNTPNPVMSAHQQKEARAWGAGMRSALGITLADLPYPSPPFPKGSTWPGTDRGPGAS